MDTQKNQDDDVPPGQKSPDAKIVLKIKEDMYSQDAQDPAKHMRTSSSLELSQRRSVRILTSPKPSLAPSIRNNGSHSDEEERARSPSPPDTRAGFDAPPPPAPKRRDSLWWKTFSSKLKKLLNDYIDVYMQFLQ